jgi:hypothetical protein
MSLNVRLNNEYEKRLGQILAMTRMDKSELTRKMIDDQWLALQAGRTFVERRGGHPKYLLNDPTKSSERVNRKAALGKHFAEKAEHRRKARP